MKIPRFPFHLYVEEYDFSNGGEPVYKVGKFRNKTLAEAAGEAFLSLENGHGIKLYGRFFVVEK